MRDEPENRTGRRPAKELEALAVRVLRSNGVDPPQAANVAKVLIWSELIGRPNFGLLRLPVLLRRVEAGVIRCPCNPQFHDSAPALRLLDADAGFGHHAGILAMDEAIALARQYGVGVVGVKNSNFFGAGAYFVNMAAEAKLIGLALSNSFPKVTVYGGTKSVLGTNPFAFGAPLGAGERPMLLDMATAASAGSTIREHIDRGLRLPEGIAVDAQGNPITDPTKVDTGTMLPFGGAKGSGLALMVEVLCGVITGAGVCHGVKSMYSDFTQSGNNGHFMLAMDPARFLPMEAFVERMGEFANTIRGANRNQDVLLPGETRWRHYDENTKFGVPVDERLLEQLKTRAE